MGNLEKIVGVMFSLIAVYLVLSNRTGFNDVLGGIGTNVTRLTYELQGRTYDNSNSTYY